MGDFQDSVKDIIQSKTDKNKTESLKSLWADICKWSEDGASMKIKDELKTRISSITAEFDTICQKFKENMENGT